MTWTDMAARLETSVFGRLSDATVLYTPQNEPPTTLTAIYRKALAFDGAEVNVNERDHVFIFKRLAFDKIGLNAPKRNDTVTLNGVDYTVVGLDETDLASDDGYEYRVKARLA